MDNAFFEALNSLGSENGLDTDTLIEKVKSAMLKAARKAYPDSEDRITVEIDPTTKTFEMYLRQDVIDDEPIDENEINIAEARNIDPSIKSWRPYPEAVRHQPVRQSRCPLRKTVHQGRPAGHQPQADSG